MKSEKFRWIVTGCNGYLGNQICRHLNSEGFSVVGVFRKGNDVNELIRLGIKCVSYEDLPDILESSDYFVHCAGKTGVAGSWKVYEKINVRWTLDLFNLALGKGIKCFIYISSVAALGYVNRKNKNVLDEKSIPVLHEKEFYGRSKLMAENQLKDIAADSTVRLVILRPGLIYGKRKISISQSWLRRGTIVNLNARIPFTHIDNFIDALKKISLCQEADDVFLVVDDEQPTQRELIHLKKELGLIKHYPWVLGLTGFRLQQTLKRILKGLLRRNKSLEAVEIEPLLRFHSRKLKYDCRRLKELTNWQPHVSLKQGWQEIHEQSSN